VAAALTARGAGDEGDLAFELSHDLAFLSVLHGPGAGLRVLRQKVT